MERGAREAAHETSPPSATGARRSGTRGGAFRRGHRLLAARPEEHARADGVTVPWDEVARRGGSHPARVTGLGAAARAPQERPHCGAAAGCSPRTPQLWCRCPGAPLSARTTFLAAVHHPHDRSAHAGSFAHAVVDGAALQKPADLLRRSWAQSGLPAPHAAPDRPLRWGVKAAAGPHGGARSWTTGAHQMERRCPGGVEPRSLHHRDRKRLTTAHPSETLVTQLRALPPVEQPCLGALSYQRAGHPPHRRRVTGGHHVRQPSPNRGHGT
jgi:hypothetical protein